MAKLTLCAKKMKEQKGVITSKLFIIIFAVAFLVLLFFV